MGLAEILIWISVYFHLTFYRVEPADSPIYCPAGSQKHTATCSLSGYALPGFPTRETWRRDEQTPLIFYGRAVHYAPGVMWATALQRGFERDYLDQFDCLVSGFFINDVGRVAWMLHEGKEYRCLVVDNARARDLYPAVILNREAVEVEYRFASDVLDNHRPHVADPIVVMAYQIDRPTPEEWGSAAQLDEYLFNAWITSYGGEPKGWIQVGSEQQAVYLIDGWGEVWQKIPGCLDCQAEKEYVFDLVCAEYYRVLPGDSLDKISKKIYGYSHPRFWDAIYAANQDKMDNPASVYPGQILKIPCYTEYADPASKSP